MSTTYLNLIDAHVNGLRLKNSPTVEQVIRNHKTALQAFLKYTQSHENSSIGSEMSENFDEIVKSYLKTSALGIRSKSDRRSILKAWKSTYDCINPQDKEAIIDNIKIAKNINNNLPVNSALPFEKALKDALKLANLTHTKAAALSGIHKSAMTRWFHGALPNIRTQKDLGKLDILFKLPEGTFNNHLLESQATTGPTQKNEFRERFKENKKIFFRLKIEELSPTFLAEWQAFFNYKTSTHPRILLRSTKGQWALSHVKHSNKSATIVNSRNNQVSASAENAWSHTQAFLGFLRLSVKEGGYGLPENDMQTLAWLAVPHAVEAYLNFMMDRSDGLKHGGHRVFCGYVISLTNATNGYLTQSPLFEKRLPANIMADISWREMCQETLAICKSWKSQAIEKSRKPEIPIKVLLNVNEPLTPIFEAMRSIKRLGDAYPHQSMLESVARRDEMLLGFLISNPLRLKNLQTLTYRADNTGSIYQTPAGQWRINIQVKHFKNGKHMAGQNYNVPIAKWLENLVSEYVKNIRPLLAKGKETEYFFLSANGLKFTTMSSQIFKITKEHIPGCGGFSPHAFRHIVATDWLQKHPNDFLTVAQLLNDSIEVIIKEYAHLKQDIAFARYEEHLQNILPAWLKN